MKLNISYTATTVVYENGFCTWSEIEHWCFSFNNGEQATSSKSSHLGLHCTLRGHQHSLFLAITTSPAHHIYNWQFGHCNTTWSEVVPNTNCSLQLLFLVQFLGDVIANICWVHLFLPCLKILYYQEGVAACTARKGVVQCNTQTVRTTFVAD